jgi:hypothetical protein
MVFRTTFTKHLTLGQLFEVFTPGLGFSLHANADYKLLNLSDQHTGITAGMMVNRGCLLLLNIRFHPSYIHFNYSLNIVLLLDTYRIVHCYLTFLIELKVLNANKLLRPNDCSISVRTHHTLVCRNTPIVFQGRLCNTMGLYLYPGSCNSSHDLPWLWYTYYRGEKSRSTADR